MQLGVAVLILICITITLLLLFYLVTRYFNHRLQKTLQNQNQVYSMIDGIQANRADFMDGEYSDFAESKINQWKRQEEERKKVYMDIAGKGILRQSLFQSQFNPCEKSSLERRLERQPIPLGPPSIRSNATPKSFSVEKLQSFRSNNSMKSNQTNGNNSSNKNNNVTKHKFLSKLVVFQGQRIQVIQNLVSQIWVKKESQQIRERRKILESVIHKNDGHFLDCIQAYGFEANTNGAFKYSTSVDIPNMRPQIIYSIKQLKQCQQKQEIEMNQFYRLYSQLKQK